MNFGKLKRLTLGILAIFCLTNIQADATKLPDDIWKYVKNQLPDAQQRFDSVITLKNGVMYIPLYPPSPKNVDKLTIEYSYPTVASLKQLPEVVLLNNGYSLLKVFKDKDGDYSLTKKDDLPIKVRLGLMPQDMLTPIGLKMPESLKLTLGDLLIPSKEESSLYLKDDDKENPKNTFSPTVKRNEFIPVNEFKNKKTLINPKNTKFLEVYEETSKNPMYELKLSSMPSKIVTSSQNGVGVILYWGEPFVEIISLKDDNVLAKIQLDNKPTDIAINKKDNIAYVTIQNEQEIAVIDLNSMQLTKVIKLEQQPSKVFYSELDDSLSFYDEFSTKVYNVTQNDTDWVVQPLDKVKNLSVIVADVANVYALSRTESKMYIFDKVQANLIATIDVDKKPTDAIVIGNKVYILCSKEGYIDVFDTTEGKIISKEKISDDGFYSKLTLIPNSKNLMVSGLNTKSYLYYNFDTMKITKKQESYIDISNIIILDKAQRL